MPPRFRNRLLVSFGLAIAVGTLLTAAHFLTFFSTAQTRSSDFLFKSRRDRMSNSIVIVGIDQQSYRTLLPRYGMMTQWPRTLYAAALDNIHRAGARVIALDIVFDGSKPGDPQLAAAMNQAGNVILPVEAQGPRGIQRKPGVAQEFDVFYRSSDTIVRAALDEGFVNVTTDPDTVVRGLPLVLEAEEKQLPALALLKSPRLKLHG